MTLSVIVGADALSHPRSGIGRVTEQVARAAARDPRVTTLRLRAGDRLHGPGLIDAAPETTPPSPLRERLARIPGAAAALRSLRTRTLDRAARALPRPVVYYEPNLIPRPFAGPTVIALHDLAFRARPDTMPPARVAHIERHLASALRATRITADSEFTRDEAVRLLCLPPERLTVVPLAAARVFRPHEADEARAALAAHDLWDRSYILGVSTLEPRKNFDGLLAAYLTLTSQQRAATPLVIVGARGWGGTLANPAATAAMARGELRLLGFVPDAALAVLYARAACLAFVSHYEGFGLPVIEAMASATPVVCSRTTAVGEVAGDAALTVDPDDPHDIAEALARVLEDRALADDLRRRGTVRAQHFSVRAMMDGLVATWQAAAA